MGKQRPSIHDIAADAGVSIATVSRVLNNHPDVSAEKRQAVMRIARERGYVTNRAAQALSRGRTNFVALMSPFLQGEYFDQIVAGAAEALYEHDARLVVCPTHHEAKRETLLLEHLAHGATDGALLLLPSESNEELATLHRAGYPFVVIDPLHALPPWVPVPVVAAANLEGATQATEHLLDLGHRRIGVITGDPPDGCASEERLRGYRLALTTRGIPYDEQLVQHGKFDVKSGQEAARKLLKLNPRPTAIFAFNDAMAVGVLHAAHELGRVVPGGLSVVGFDDVQIAEVAIPQLTTVHQPLREMGRIGAERLLRLVAARSTRTDTGGAIAAEGPMEAQRVELSTRLVRQGTSTARCRGGTTRS